MALVIKNLKSMNPLGGCWITLSRQRRGRFSVLCAALLGLANFAVLGNAQYSEYAVKAACIANFVNFVRWPAEALPDASTPLIIGILGNDPFGAVLDTTLREQSANGRTMKVRRGRAVEDLRGCQMVFISRSEVGNLGRTLAGLRGGVLTVSDIPGFARQGGMIGFVMEGDKVRFEINAPNAQRAELEITSRLLRLAKGAG